jgi:hypothetical protein
MSGSLDRMVRPEVSRSTARDWGADYGEVVGLSHMLPVEPGWPDVAKLMLEWLCAIRRAQVS